VEFSFNDDQRLFQSTVRDLFDKECATEHVRAAWASDDGRIAGLWAKLADIGVVGLTAPGDAGGMGLDEVDLVLLLEESGRAGLPDPLVENAAVAVPLLRDAGDTEWLSRVAAGSASAAVGFASEPYVVGAGSADVLLLQANEEVWAVPAGEVATKEEPALDRGRRLFRVSWSPGGGTCVARGNDAHRLLDAGFDRAALGTAAQLVGLADRIIELTAEYAREREQFGKPIGSFQAVKHHLANARIRLEFARPAVYRAAHSVATDAPTRARDLSMAKVFASEAGLLAAKVGLQVHGAIGYTWEHDLHLFMKPVWARAVAYGDTAWHRARVARVLGLA
jgi:alkylation response protein AidB-like acyl-CoA dehydrogenase